MMASPNTRRTSVAAFSSAATLRWWHPCALEMAPTLVRGLQSLKTFHPTAWASAAAEKSTSHVGLHGNAVNWPAHNIPVEVLDPEKNRSHRKRNRAGVK